MYVTRLNKSSRSIVAQAQYERHRADTTVYIRKKAMLPLR